MNSHITLAQMYAPIIHLDKAETIPLQKVGITVFSKSDQSLSFKRCVHVPLQAKCVIEYAYYWDFDIQHMYDLEHIWVTVGLDGQPIYAEASFHGKYLTLYAPDLPYGMPPNQTHIHAFCQPGKHAFLPDGQMFRLVPMWYECCNSSAGGGVLVGGPFNGIYSTNLQKDLISNAYIQAHFPFAPTLVFETCVVDNACYIPWEDLAKWIPQRIESLLEQMDKQETE